MAEARIQSAALPRASPPPADAAHQLDGQAGLRSAHGSHRHAPSQPLSKQPPHSKAPRQHVVGRVQRNTSHGKNLNKLANAGAATAASSTAMTAATGRHHRRVLSGNGSVPSSGSPRPGVKRNASSATVVRAAAAAAAVAGAATADSANSTVRKNNSNGHLVRQGASKSALKASGSEMTPPRRTPAQPGGLSSRRASAEDVAPHPTVHFDVGSGENGDDNDDDEHDDVWTEESASQSPHTTRSNTRANSVILDPQKTAAASRPAANRPSSPISQARQASGAPSSHHAHRPPDADMITSRLLQRHATHNAPPQMSSVAATAVLDLHDARVLSQSQGSMLVGSAENTPSRDVVSRFVDSGSGSAGYPSSFLPSRNSPQRDQRRELSDMESADAPGPKRATSAPNMADDAGRDGSPTPPRAPALGTGTHTPIAPLLPPSRTQQKLLLQRASSALEPRKAGSSGLPHGGGPLQTGSSTEGRLDARMQHHFSHIAAEYRVVRRFRNPVADALARLQALPSRDDRTAKAVGVRAWSRSQPRDDGSTHSFSMRGWTRSHRRAGSGASVASETIDEATGVDSRAGLAGEQSDGAHGAELRHQDRDAEVQELCRRLWDAGRAELPGAD